MSKALQTFKIPSLNRIEVQSLLTPQVQSLETWANALEFIMSILDVYWFIVRMYGKEEFWCPQDCMEEDKVQLS